MKSVIIETEDGIRRIETRLVGDQFEWAIFKPDRRKVNAEQRGKWERYSFGYGSHRYASKILTNIIFGRSIHADIIAAQSTATATKG